MMFVPPRESTGIFDTRNQASRCWYNRVDPVYVVLDRLLFSPFFTPRLPGPGAQPVPIEVWESRFLLDNLRKHRIIVWVNLVAVVAMIASGLTQLEQDALLPLLPGFAAPVVVSGIAWYSISFSGVPERFGRHAMLVTGVLFFATSVSSTTLYMLLAVVMPAPVATLVLLPIYAALYIAAICYDNLDGLRAAANQRSFVFSRAQAYGDHRPADALTVQLSKPPTNFVSGFTVESFDESAATIDRHLEELSGSKTARIANFLVGDCLKQVSRLLNLTTSPLDPGTEFEAFVAMAHEMSVAEVNEKAGSYLRLALERLQSLLGDSMADEGDAIANLLLKIELIRSESPSDVVDSADNENQELADFLFVEVFRRIVSVMRGNRSQLIGLTTKPPNQRSHVPGDENSTVANAESGDNE